MKLAKGEVILQLIFIILSSTTILCNAGLRLFAADFDIDTMNAQSPCCNATPIQECVYPDDVILSNNRSYMILTPANMSETQTYVQMGNTKYKFFNMRIQANNSINGTTPATFDGQGLPFLANTYFVDSKFTNLTEAMEKKNSILGIRLLLRPENIPLDGGLQNADNAIKQVSQPADMVKTKLNYFSSFFDVREAMYYYFYEGNFTFPNQQDATYNTDYVYAVPPEFAQNVSQQLYDDFIKATTGTPTGFIETNNPPVCRIDNTK